MGEKKEINTHCRVCAKELRKPNALRKFCATCRREATRRLNRERYQRVKDVAVWIKCQRCGCEFRHQNRRRHFCDACLKLNRVERHQDKKRLEESRARPVPVEKVTPRCRGCLQEVALVRHWLCKWCLAELTGKGS